jgi:APA family basic amino acid/polyamine antiporter
MGKTKVLVALRDVQSLESLVTLACQISSGMEAELTALHVVEIPMATPIDADDEVLDRPGHEILECARKYAAEHFSRPLTTKLLRARQAGEALVGEASEQGIDTLVMGHHQPHTLGEILLGSTAQYVARHAPCRVIVQIPPARHR